MVVVVTNPENNGHIKVNVVKNMHGAYPPNRCDNAMKETTWS
jgi:hypothetical protein